MRRFWPHFVSFRLAFPHLNWWLVSFLGCNFFLKERKTHKNQFSCFIKSISLSLQAFWKIVFWLLAQHDDSPRFPVSMLSKIHRSDFVESFESTCDSELSTYVETKKTTSSIYILFVLWSRSTNSLGTSSFFHGSFFQNRLCFAPSSFSSVKWDTRAFSRKSVVKR